MQLYQIAGMTRIDTIVPIYINRKEIKGWNNGNIRKEKNIIIKNWGRKGIIDLIKSWAHSHGLF